MASGRVSQLTGEAVYAPSGTDVQGRASQFLGEAVYAPSGESVQGRVSQLAGEAVYQILADGRASQLASEVLYGTPPSALSLWIKRSGEWRYTDFSNLIFKHPQADYVARKTHEINSPQTLEIWLREAAGWQAVERHNEVQLDVLTYAGQGQLFTGFIINDPEKFLVGVDAAHAPQYAWRLVCASEEILLDLNSPIHFASLPTFQNQTPAQIISALMEILSPGRLEAYDFDDGEIVPVFEIDEDEVFTEVVRRLCEAQNLKFWTRRGKAFLKAYNDATLGVDAIETDADYNPDNLTVRPQSLPIYNDVMAYGPNEPQAYVREHWAGDGLTPRFPLTLEPWGVETATVLSDDFTSGSLNTNLWQESDPGFHVGFGASLAVASGFGVGQTYVAAKSGFEMAGQIVFQHGAVRFSGASEGIVGGLYNAPVGWTEAECTFGFKCTPSGSNTKIEALHNGTVASGGTPLVTAAGFDYILQTLVGVPYTFRRSNTFFSWQSPTGWATGVIDSPGLVTLRVLRVDQNAPEKAPVEFVLWREDLNTLPAFLSYAVINSANLNLSLNFCDIYRPPNASLLLRTPSGTVATKSLGSERDFNADAALVAGTEPALAFYSDRAPSAGYRVELRYRGSGPAVVRLKDSASIAAEAARAGDSGVRAGVLPELDFAPRNSEELELATAAYIADHIDPVYEGNFKIDTLKRVPPYEPLPGRYMTVAATGMYPSFTALVKKVTSDIIVQARDDTEYLSYGFDFGPLLRVEQITRRFGAQSPASKADRTSATPAAVEADDVGATQADDLPAAQFNYTMSATGFTLDAGAAPPSGGRIEVRWSDAQWGASGGLNQIATSTAQVFIVPRNSRQHAFYLKMVNASGQVSRYPALVKINFPLVPPIPPNATVQTTNRLYPAAVVPLPADPSDVYGIEIRASDDTTVLHQYGDLALSLTPNDPALSYTHDNSVVKSRSITLNVHFWNVLREYGSLRAVIIDMPAPVVTGLTLDAIDQSVKWTADPAAVAYDVQVARDGAFTDLVASSTVDGNRVPLSIEDVVQTRYFRARGLDALGVGNWASGSHSYTTTGLHEWGNTNQIESVGFPPSPGQDPSYGGQFDAIQREMIEQAWSDYNRNATTPSGGQFASVAIWNMQTAEPVFDAFEVEVWDSTRTTLIEGPGRATGTYDSALSRWKQNAAKFFTGLQRGTTYSFRARVFAFKGASASSWSAWADETAGDTTAPATTYGAAWSSALGSAIVIVTPSGAPSDTERYDWYWQTASAPAPGTSTTPNLSPVHAGAELKKTFAASSTVWAWIRAVDTSGNRQAWASLGNGEPGTVSLVSGNAQGSTADPTTTSTSPVDVPNCSTTIVTKGSPVMVVFHTTARNSDAGNSTYFQITRDSGTADSKRATCMSDTTNALRTISIVWLDSPAAGSHTYKAEWWVDAGTTGTAEGTNREIVAVEVGS